MSNVVIQGNKPLRFLAIMMTIMVLVAHFLGQINLASDWVFWIMLVMCANAIQASFTGFCPMFKNARGECVACGVQCSGPSCGSEQQSETPSR